MNKPIEKIREDMAKQFPAGQGQTTFLKGFDLGALSKDTEWKEAVRELVQSLEWYAKAGLTGDIYIDGKRKRDNFEISGYAKAALESFRARGLIK